MDEAFVAADLEEINDVDEDDDDGEVPLAAEDAVPVDDDDVAVCPVVVPPCFCLLLLGWYLYSGWTLLCLSLSLSASCWKGSFSSSFRILHAKKRTERFLAL